MTLDRRDLRATRLAAQSHDVGLFGAVIERQDDGVTTIGQSFGDVNTLRISEPPPDGNDSPIVKAPVFVFVLRLLL